MSHSWIMKPLNIIEHIGTGFVPGSIFPMADSLALKYTKEPFAGSIIPAMTYSTHTAHQRMLLQQSLVVTTGKLASTI